MAVTTPPAEVRHIIAARTSVPPRLDGRLDDQAWALAQPSDAFTMKFPREGVAATEKTTVRVLYDDQAVYVGFDCTQRLSPVVGRLTRRDRPVESDSVTVVLDTRHDGRTAFEFSVDAAGVLSDGLHFNDTDFSSDWDENWDARTSRTESGWSAEFRIPLRVLRFRSGAHQSWGFEARRYVSARQEQDEWQYIPRTAGGEVSRYGVLEGLRNLSPRHSVELWTTAIARARHLEPSANQIASGLDASASGEIDARWAPNDDLTLEATLNPDFAQVEADQLVLNLTTYETWYPEKRPFFLEGLDTFSTPFTLLYTRRIGRAAAAPTLRTNLPTGDEELVDVPGPATIYGATKLVGVLAPGWRVGVLDALVAENDVQVQEPNGARLSRLVDPLTAFQVVRARRIFSGRADLGLTLTSTVRAEPTGQYPLVPSPGGPATQLCPDGTQRPAASRCFHDAYVGGIDGHWRSVDGVYAITGQAIASMIGAGAPVAFPDGTTAKTGDVAPGLSLTAAKQGGDHWVGNVGYAFEGKRLDFDDLGFMDRQNQHYADLGIEYRRLTPWGKTLESHFRFDAVERDNTAGLNLSRSYQLSTSGRTTGFWIWWAAAYYRPAHFDDQEVGDGTALERAGLVGSEAYLSSDPRRDVSAHAWAQAQALTDGSQVAADVDVLWHAMSRLDLELEPNALFTSGEPRYTGTTLGAHDYMFGRLAAKNVGATLRATYTFMPRLTLQAFAQLFVASGHYSDLTQFTAPPRGPAIAHLADLRPLVGAAPSTNPDFEQAALNVNIVLRWEFLLGSTLFAVYTRSQSPSLSLPAGEPATLDFTSVGRAAATDAVALKLSYWWG